MYEIEAKVRLSAKDRSRLKSELDQKAEFKGIFKKEDIYYLMHPNEQIRLRTVGDKAILSCILSYKQKEGAKGAVERNQETEWPLEHPELIKSILSKLGAKPVAKKFKTTYLYFYRDFSVELNQVRGLGYFLEIERLVSHPSGIESAHKKLLRIFKEFGFGEKDFEKKQYLRLLQEKKGN